MRRALGTTLVVVVILVAVLIVNAVVLDSQTKSAEQTVDDGQLIELSNAELQYTDSEATGPGPEGQPIVLLHCYTCSHQWWAPLAPLLNEGHRVIAFDLIGHGGSEKPSSGYEIETQSGAIAEALNELGVRGATVVGHSLGGVVAASLSEQSSELVDRVVLIGTPAEAGDGELPFTAKASTAPLVGPAIWRLKLNSMVKSAAAESFAPGADVEALFDDPDRVVEDVDAMTFKSFESAQGVSNDFLEEGSLASRLAGTGVPVLAMDGTEDQIIDAEEMLADLRAIPGARTIAIDGVGHAPNVEDPDLVARQILNFVDAGGIVSEAPAAAPSGQGADREPRASGDGGDANRGGGGRDRSDRQGGERPGSGQP